MTAKRMDSSGGVIACPVQVDSEGNVIRYYPPKDYVRSEFASQGLKYCAEVSRWPDETAFANWVISEKIGPLSRVVYSDNTGLIGFLCSNDAFAAKIWFG